MVWYLFKRFPTVQLDIESLRVTFFCLSAALKEKKYFRLVSVNPLTTPTRMMTWVITSGISGYFETYKKETTSET
jgi:hypothetical protein